MEVRILHVFRLVCILKNESGICVGESSLRQSKSEVIKPVAAAARGKSDRPVQTASSVHEIKGAGWREVARADSPIIPGEIP